MTYSPFDILRKFVMRKCIEHLVVTSENPVWFNLTFWENVTNKQYANKCWHRLKMALCRKYSGFRLVGVWARQGRGAWHIHAVCNQRVDIDWLRTKAMRAGFGSQIFLKQLDSGYKTPEKISRYICGYCTDKNALDKDRDKGVRRTIFVGKYVRIIDMRYKSGLKKVTSMGREMSETLIAKEFEGMTDFQREFSAPLGRKKPWETWGDWYRRNRDYWFELGWLSLSIEEREEILEMDEYCKRYFDTGRWSYV